MAAVTGGGNGNVGAPSYPQASLYVGDLQPDVQESQLFEKFSAIGPVLSIRICRDALSKASLGYGYVNFSKPADAERALEELNFDAVGGVPLRLMWSHRDPTLRRSGDGNIFIKNLDKTVDNKALYDTFSSFGKILSCKVALNENGSSKGFAFVHFETGEAAKEAISKVNGKLIHEKKVFVGLFKSREARAKELGEAYPKFLNVYVKNFGPEMNEESLKKLAEEYGPVVSVFLPTDQETKRPRGYAFIAYGNSEAAHKAVQDLNGKEMGGVKMYANRAMKKEERQAELRHKADMRKRQAAQRHQGVNLYIKNLEDTVTEARLSSEFSKFGTVTSAKVMMNDVGVSRGFGFVCFATPEEANKAVTEMNGRIIVTKPLFVALAQRKEERRAQLASQFMHYRVPSSVKGSGPNNGMYNQPMGGGYYMATNTGYPANPPAFVPNPRPTSAPSAGGRWGSAMGSAYRFAYPTYGPPGGAVQGATRGAGGRPAQYAQPTATRLIHGLGAGAEGRWGGANHNNSSLNYQVQYHQGARNRPLEGPYGHSAQKEVGPGASAAEEKQILGEELYPHVAELVDDGNVGKVTGMLLEMPNDDIVKMLHQPKKLQAKVQEALAVLMESGVKG